MQDWSGIKQGIKKVFGMRQGLNEEEIAQAKKEIANIDWNKVSQNSPKLGWDTDTTNVQDYQEAKKTVEDYQEQKEEQKKEKEVSMAQAGLEGLSEFGKSMAESAAKRKQPEMRFGSVEQAMGGPVDVMSARRKALIELINKGS